MQCACPVLHCHLWSVLLYHISPHYLTNSTVLEEKLTKTKCVFFFNFLYISLRNISGFKKKSAKCYRVFTYSTHHSCILVRFQSYLKFLDIFSKNTKISNFMKIRRVGAQLLHADGQTDVRKLMVAFRNFANAPKNCPM